MPFTLATPRLLLRELVPADEDAIFRMLSDPEAMRYFPSTYDREGARAWIARNQQRYADAGHGLWAVTLRESGEVLGDCGVVWQQVDGAREAEVGYHFLRDHWGHGYASEAARACRDWAFRHLDVPRVISLVRPENQPSARVAQRNGMSIAGHTVRAGLPHHVYAITRQDWQRLTPAVAPL